MSSFPYTSAGAAPATVAIAPLRLGDAFALGALFGWAERWLQRTR